MKIQIPCLSVVLLLLSGALAAAGGSDQISDQARRERALSAYGRLPLSFEVNAGQVDANVRFLGRSQGLTLFLTDDEAVLSLRGPEWEKAIVRMHPAGGTPRRPSGANPLPTHSNYFLGNDPSRWHTDVPHYAQVRYESVYPGVDLVYRGNPQQLEYDFVIAPGADPGQIRLAFQGASEVSIGPAGELILHTASGDLVQRAPVLYQETGQEREPVEGRYVLLDEQGEVGFAVGRYDRARALVIDPVIVYSTFLGGALGEVSQDIAVDGSGNVYITGFVESTRFGVRDVFVTKINSSGTAIVYSTVLGGSDDEFGRAIAADAAGNAYVAGFTFSPTFPGVTAKSIQPAHAPDGIGGLDADGYVTKINATGNAILYSTFLGGDASEEVSGIAVDGSGNAYLTGGTSSTSFPGVTAGSLQPATGGGFGDGFVTKINPAGTAIVYSTFLGGDRQDGGLAIALDGAGNVYVTGFTNSTAFPGVTAGSIQPANGGGIFDAFVTKINPAGTAIVYSTFLGGDRQDEGGAIALDGAGNAYVTGRTLSSAFPGVTDSSIQPVNGGDKDAFITKINAAGSAILYSTFLGSPSRDETCCLAVDSAGNAYIAGDTTSKTFPGVGPGSMQPANAGGDDFFVTKIDPSGTRILDSTFLGGSGSDTSGGMAIDGAGNLYLAGSTTSQSFPGVNAGSIQPVNAGGAGDVILTKISPLDFLPTRAGSCAVLTACRDARTYPCCTSEPVCRCRPQVADDADCTAGGKAATGCSITVQ